MRYVVAILGGLLVFGMTFLVVVALLSYFIPLAPLIAAILAFWVAKSSFKATLKHYDAKEKQTQAEER